MRILLDYRPALRERTGVGEYVHELTRALRRSGHEDAVTIFTSSWKDRPAAGLAADLGDVRIVDWRLPVRGLTWMWHRHEWPPVEWLAGDVDVVHAQSPLLIPARRAAQVVTIHDLDFLHHPERVRAEMRRDFPRLVRDHARRADHVIVSSHYTAREVVSHLEIAGDKVSVCSPGAPDWARDVAEARARRTAPAPGVLLFVGTVDERKNVRRLLDAYALLQQHRPDAPPLVIAGHVRTNMPEVANVTWLGYVSDAQRRDLYFHARLLVMPSLEEGFGLPVLEAMACGVPVAVSNRGSLPEVAGDAAVPFDPTDTTAITDAIDRLLDPVVAQEATHRGLAQAARYSWAACAATAREAYRAAVAAHTRRTT